MSVVDPDLSRDDVDVVVDLATGAIFVLLPPDEHGERLEVDRVEPDDPWAPQE